MAKPYLKLTGISKSFPSVRALIDVDFEAYAGEAIALLGANGAGKSTLMNVLGGVIQAETGQIIINEETVKIRTPLDAAAHGIAFVHQEMAMLPTLTVMENMYISSFLTKKGLLQKKLMMKKCDQVLSQLGCTFPSDTKIQHLGAGDRQMVEISRALLAQARVVIFDEPTSSLTGREKKRLFDVIRTLKAEGVTIIFITHFLDEAFEICDRINVMRGGEMAAKEMIADTTLVDVIKAMLGDVTIKSHERGHSVDLTHPVLRVKGLKQTGILEDINFTLHKGEILGLWGLLGSGRTELVRALIGLDPLDGGQIEIRTNGTLRPVRPQDTKKLIGMITEDRREEGLFLPMSVKQNMSMANLPNILKPLGFVDVKTEETQSQDFVKRLGIKVASLDQPVETLSGGNQQKVVVGRWLQFNPKIYIMDEPTRGLDVSAKAEICNIIFELAQTGAAIIVINSEIDEILTMCDRYLVINKGRFVAEFSSAVTKDELITAAAGSSSANGGV